MNAGGIVRVYIDGWLITGIKELNHNEYNHVATLIKDNTLYLFINGVLDGIYNNSPSLSNSYIYLGDYGSIQDGTLWDDLLVVKGDSIIDPSGKSIGTKCFEPPVRRSLNSEFIEY